MKLVMRKANYSEKLQALMKRRGDDPESQLERFRALILDHLAKQEDEEEGGGLSKTMQKTLNFAERLVKGGKGLPVGTVREWKGKKYVKVSPGKWRPKYDGETRGAKMAVAAIRRKIAAAPDAQTMLQIVLENRDRFSDQKGQPLPFVQELSAFVRDKSDAVESAAKTKKGEEKKPTYDELDQVIATMGGSNAYREGDSIIITEIGKEKRQPVKSDIDRMKRENQNLNIEYKNGKIIITKKDKREKAKTKEKPQKQKDEKRRFSIEELNDGWKSGVLTELEIAENLEDEEVFQDFSASTWKAHAKNIEDYRAGKIGAKELDEKQHILFSDKNKVKKHGEQKKPKQTENEKKKQGEDKNEPIKDDKETSPEEELIKLVGEEKAKQLIAELQKPEYSVDAITQRMFSDFRRIQDKYQNAKAVDGDEDEIQVGKEVIPGKWKLVEADTPTASHDETTFHKTPGFPADENGSTINDRDYGHDKDAQNIVVEIAGDYDGRAVSVDNPVIVTKDGIVISGNNRTMSSKIAAKNGTDTGYIETLKRKAKKFGFTAEQIGEFQHPRVVFETVENDGYSTEQFAKFNRSSKKAMSPIEAAVKVSKTIKGETVAHIAEKISDFDTLGELYGDSGAINEIFNTLQQDGIIASVDRPQYVVDGGGITGAGKEFLETVLIGSVVDEKNIRGLNRDGCKSIRQKLVRAITPLIENKGMSGYSIAKELNEAVDLSMQVAIHKNFNNVDELVSQGKLFGKDEDPVSVEIARKLEGTQKSFAEFMQTMNGGLKYAAQGEADIFLGGVETREDILSRMLNLKKTIQNVIGFFKGLHFFKGDFIKKAVPVFKDGGAVEYADRWMPESTELSKSLTWSGHKLQGRTKFQGMDISIENKKGSTRSGTDKDGHEWHTLMHFNYGYIRGTVGKDKDHLDCYLGPNSAADTVFIVHQNDPVTGKYDEDKIMLGFEGEEEAKEAYLKQYDRPGFLGSIDKMDIETFRQKAFDPANKGKMIKE